MVNRTSLYRYLARNQMDHAPETFFAGVEQLPPGHYLEARLEDPAQFSLMRYHRAVPTRTNLSFEEAAHSLRELVVRSVTSQSGSAKSIGSAHSGGFDSSFVVACFERANPAARLQLFTCVPHVKSGAFSRSEEPWADLASSSFRSSTIKVRVSSDDLPGEFPALVCLQEEPFSSPVVYAQWRLFRAAQESGIETMLSGQGGDTLFACSTDQLLQAILLHVRRGDLGGAAALLKARSLLSDGSLARAAVREILPDGLRGFAKRFNHPPHPDWLKREWFEFNDPEPASSAGLPMLRFEDRNSVACSIVNRMPLLTVELQDFVRSLPPDYLVTANQPIKSIECAAMRGLVPDAILARRERWGFPVPVREWLHELAPWADGYMREVASLPFLETRRVLRIWESVRAQNSPVSAAFLVWRWIFLAGWLRYFNVHLGDCWFAP
jgi:asparagine synthase (glutamine-hydrolysing)